MKRLFNQESVTVPSHFMYASILIVTGMLLLSLRLWWLQVFRGDYYRARSEMNRIRKIEIPAPRGLIFDRDGELLLDNRPFFDLVYIPQFVKDKDATLRILASLLHGSVEHFEQRLRVVRGQPGFLPVILKRNLTTHEMSLIKANRIFLPGVDVAIAPRRNYSADTPPHMIGYLGEVDPHGIIKLNQNDPSNPYFPGDLIGKSGLEQRFERELRGRRGFRLIQVDALGRQTSETHDMPLPTQAAQPGDDMVLTIDRTLQKAAMEAFKGKHGAVVAIDPRDGQVLVLYSSPGFDPTIFQERISIEQWRELSQNPFNPLLDKTTGGEYPPGSTWKALVALAALEEKIITPETKFYCPGSFTLGNQVFHCHQREGHGHVDLAKALYRSCDVYFFHVGMSLGPDRIAKYAREFMLGRKSQLGLNMDLPGIIPTTAWREATFRSPWMDGETPSLAIGQGYNLVTPLQLANLYASIGSQGKVFRPWLVQKILSPLGKLIRQTTPILERQANLISPETYNLVKNALQQVVEHPEGTGKRAAVKDHTVAGKTGSVQVAKLRKGLKVSEMAFKLREHALFAAFSPVDSPEIAIAVISEHDEISGGGASAAPVAGAVLRAYWEQKARVEALTIQSLNREGSPP
jgi:penicillin-binding protein 2